MTTQVFGEFRTGLWTKVRKQLYTIEVRGIKIPLSWEELIEVQNKINFELSGGIKSSVEATMNEIINKMDIKFTIENFKNLVDQKFNVDLCSNCELKPRHNLKHEGEEDLLCQECEKCCKTGFEEKIQ